MFTAYLLLFFLALAKALKENISCSSQSAQPDPTCGTVAGDPNVSYEMAIIYAVNAQLAVLGALGGYFLRPYEDQLRWFHFPMWNWGSSSTASTLARPMLTDAQPIAIVDPVPVAEDRSSAAMPQGA